MTIALDKKDRAEVDEFIKMLQHHAAGNLVSVVLYGSAASHEYSSTYSDVNLLCVLSNLGAEQLEAIASSLRWWEQKGRTALVLSRDEIVRSADVFAIELLDMQERHETLFGEDLISTIPVPMTLHRVQVERELRVAIIRLRQRYASVSKDRKAVASLLASSSSTFHTLLRHSLIAMGEAAPSGRSEVIDRLHSVLNADVSALRTVLDLREGRVKDREIDVQATFRGYLDTLGLLVDEVDRRLSA